MFQAVLVRSHPASFSAHILHCMLKGVNSGTGSVLRCYIHLTDSHHRCRNKGQRYIKVLSRFGSHLNMNPVLLDIIVHFINRKGNTWTKPPVFVMCRNIKLRILPSVPDSKRSPITDRQSRPCRIGSVIIDN